MNPALIFLDFDGVLNSTSSMLAFEASSDPEMQPAPNPMAIGLMARLCREADARVVISSSWRIGSTVESLQGTLRRWCGGEIASRVIDVTPQCAGKRGDQIARWLSDHPGNDNFVIVDDDTDMLPGQISRFVQTRHRDGFTLPDYLKALRVVVPHHRDLVQLGWYEHDRPASSSYCPQPVRSWTIPSDPREAL